jgi:hypothetical protein
MSVGTKPLKRIIERLLSDQKNDLRLRDHLEGVRQDRSLPGLTWFWGPELYARNRVVFREFILAHFSDFELKGVHGWRRVKWREHADRLDSWLAEARTNRDAWLVRRLLRWKFAKEPWGIDNVALCRELLREYQAAAGPAAQAIVLEEFDDWFELDESTALALYQTNRASSKFLLKHLPSKTTFWGGEKREMWNRMFDATTTAGDDELAFALYRRLVDLRRWRSDIERLEREITDPLELNRELETRHPEGWGLNLGDGVLALLKRRGHEVFPYVRSKLQTLVGGWYGRSSPGPFLELARARGWWDLWAAIVRSANDAKFFNREIGALLDDTDLDDATRIERLRALAGVSREWNWPGIGLAQVHSLEDRLATRLYRRYPELAHGPFKPNIVPQSWQGGPLLLAAAQEANDDDFVDLLASRYITRVGYDHAWFGKEQAAMLKVAAQLAQSFQGLRDSDAETFARRAANVLTQVPAFAIHSYDRLLRTNDLARLFFVRSFPAFLTIPAAVRDLVEASEVHVQMLAYRVLAQDDDRARGCAVESLEILLGTLLRPLHHKTRRAAFLALANAARSDAATAARILRRARLALRLPDKRYPKEQLVGLIGQILHAWPELRGTKERPVVYGLTEAVP